MLEDLVKRDEANMFASAFIILRRFISLTNAKLREI